MPPAEQHVERAVRSSTIPLCAAGGLDVASMMLVTGATGLVGNNVVRQALEQGQLVRVLVRASKPGGGTGT